jgi:hypothetical protein
MVREVLTSTTTHILYPQQPELFRFTEGILRLPIRDGANILNQ